LSLALLVSALQASAQINVPPTDVSRIPSIVRGVARDAYPSGVSAKGEGGPRAPCRSACRGSTASHGIQARPAIQAVRSVVFRASHGGAPRCVALEQLKSH
jgi:hypothetical protein